MGVIMLLIGISMAPGVALGGSSVPPSACVNGAECHSFRGRQQEADSSAPAQGGVMIVSLCIYIVSL